MYRSFNCELFSPHNISNCRALIKYSSMSCDCSPRMPRTALAPEPRGVRFITCWCSCKYSTNRHSCQSCQANNQKITIQSSNSSNKDQTKTEQISTRLKNGPPLTMPTPTCPRRHHLPARILPFCAGTCLGRPWYWRGCCFSNTTQTIWRPFH